MRARPNCLTRSMISIASVAAVVALAAGVEAVGIVLAGVDAGDDEVAAHHRAVLADVGAAAPADRARRLGSGLRFAPR